MKHIVGLILLLATVHSFSFGQDTLTKKEIRKKQKSFLIPGRPWTFEVPLWIPGFAGSFAYGDASIEGEDGVDPENPIEPPPGGDIGKIISRLFSKNWYLKFFYLTKLAYENKDFLVQLDGIGGAVGNSVKFKANNQQIVQANFQTINVRLFAGYRYVDVYSKNKKFRYELFGYLGARAHFQKIYSDVDGVINKIDINPTWLEPVFGIQNQFSWRRWFLVIQGDYGGFFVASKYSIQLTGYVYYRTGRLTSLKFGWNHLNLKHKGSLQNEEYKVNVKLSGPSVAIVFHF